MADESKESVEPRGFGHHTRGLAGEYAHEQGWGLDDPERTLEPATPQDTDGGSDYEYGARDFGDTPVNTAIDHPEDKQADTPDSTLASNDVLGKE